MRGRAWISQTTGPDQRPSDFVGYWETDDDEPRILEDGLRWSSLEPALAWARERAPVVMVRLAFTDYYSAGREQPSWRPAAPRWADTAPGESAPGESAPGESAPGESAPGETTDPRTTPGLPAGTVFRGSGVTRF